MRFPITDVNFGSNLMYTVQGFLSGQCLGYHSGYKLIDLDEKSIEIPLKDYNPDKRYTSDTLLSFVEKFNGSYWQVTQRVERFQGGAGGGGCPSAGDGGSLCEAGQSGGTFILPSVSQYSHSKIDLPPDFEDWLIKNRHASSAYMYAENLKGQGFLTSRLQVYDPYNICNEPLIGGGVVRFVGTNSLPCVSNYTIENIPPDGGDEELNFKFDFTFTPSISEEDITPTESIDLAGVGSSGSGGYVAGGAGSMATKCRINGVDIAIIGGQGGWGWWGESIDGLMRYKAFTINLDNLDFFRPGGRPMVYKEENPKILLDIEPTDTGDDYFWFSALNKKLQLITILKGKIKNLADKNKTINMTLKYTVRGLTFNETITKVYNKKISGLSFVIVDKNDLFEFFKDTVVKRVWNSIELEIITDLDFFIAEKDLQVRLTGADTTESIKPIPKEIEICDNICITSEYNSVRYRTGSSFVSILEGLGVVDTFSVEKFGYKEPSYNLEIFDESYITEAFNIRKIQNNILNITDDISVSDTIDTIKYWFGKKSEIIYVYETINPSEDTKAKKIFNNKDILTENIAPEEFTTIDKATKPNRLLL